MTQKYITQQFLITDFEVFYTKMLNWLSKFNIYCLLHNNNYKPNTSGYQITVAVNSILTFAHNTNALKGLQDISNLTGQWLFGHITYNLKNELENLTTATVDHIGFPIVQFFVPEMVLQISSSSCSITSCVAQPQSIYNSINDNNETLTNATNTSITLSPVQSKQAYTTTVNTLKKHVSAGDCYEINYCQNFNASNITINPVTLYKQLNQASPMPYSSLYRQGNKYAIGASPELYITTNGNTITSGPIKGTIKRNPNPAIDAALIQQLTTSVKERAENIMVVDLVRNDLSKICLPQTVQVSKLCEVKSYKQVHHLVSTVTGTLHPSSNFATIIAATFPMGSMTGAPKVKVMQLIDNYENTNRGLYSGTIGYIQPNGNLNFNVVIRSILYNAANKYISYTVGSGITAYCEAEAEYDECLLKAQAMEQVLSNS